MTVQDVNLLRRIFLMMNMSKFFADGLDFFLSPEFFRKLQGDNEVELRGIILLFLIKGFCSYKLFQINHDCVLKIYETCNFFYKICLKAIRDILYFYCDQERDRGIQFFGEIISNRKRKLNFWACKETPKLPSLVGHPNLHIRRMVGLLTE